MTRKVDRVVELRHRDDKPAITRQADPVVETNNLREVLGLPAGLNIDFSGAKTWTYMSPRCTCEADIDERHAPDCPCAIDLPPFTIEFGETPDAANDAVKPADEGSDRA